MKIIITGHTRGIGKGLFDYFSKQNEVTGFSKSTGYNIEDPTIQDTIISASNDADIFINNAYSETNQIILGKKWFEKNKNRKSLIINIGSIANEFQKYYQDFEKTNDLSKYVKDKLDLTQLSWEINFSNNYAKSILICPGIVDTELAEYGIPKYYAQFKEKGILISVNQVVDIVVYALDNYKSSVFIPTVYIFNNIK